jgi:hypothetical protein
MVVCTLTRITTHGPRESQMSLEADEVVRYQDRGNTNDQGYDSRKRPFAASCVTFHCTQPGFQQPVKESVDCRSLFIVQPGKLRRMLGLRLGRFGLARKSLHDS